MIANCICILQPFHRNSLLKCALHKWLLPGCRSLMPSCAGFLKPRKSTLGPSKSTFNAENFTCSFSVSISIDFGAVHSWNVSCSPKSPKIHKKTPILAFKVIEFSGNQEPVYDFLLVINSNLGPISHRYYTATYWLKITNFFPPSSHLGSSFGWPTSNLRESFMVPETRVFQAADGKDLVILACTIFDWSTRVTDRQTDRQTDGQNCDG